MRGLLPGIILIAVSIGAAFGCRPRNGKMLSFVQKPFIGPLVSILIVTGASIGLILIAAYFTTIDDATLAG